MTIVSICSSKGSPGVTTLACAIAATWPENRRILVAECDPSGGDLAARFGLSSKLGMTSLVLESRRSAASAVPSVEPHLQRLHGGLEVLVGAVGASAARMVDDELPGLVGWLKQFASDLERTSDVTDLIVDCGRIQPGALGQVAVMAASDHVLLMIRPTVEGVASAGWLAERLSRFDEAPSASHGSRRSTPSARLVVAGEGPVRPAEAANSLGLRVAAVVGPDRVGASALRGEPMSRWRLSGCPLIRISKEMTRSLVPIRPAKSATQEESPEPAHDAEFLEVGS
jgi:MinD-like ATPase involved in chromosome partitioning or flagellar assembly